jgi:hypothetical protein
VTSASRRETCPQIASRVIEKIILEFRPLQISSADWNAVGPGIRAVVLKSACSPATARKHLTHTAAFAIWARTEGADIVEALNDADWIERYVAVGMAGYRESTRATRRSALRCIARRTAPSSTPKAEAISYRVLKPPYESWQVRRFVELAESQPTKAQRRNLGAVLALGLGAGLDGRDMAWVRGVDVRRGVSALHVRVSGGSRPREVVVLDRFADRIEDSAAGMGDGLVIGGQTLGRHNVTSVALGRMIGDRALPTLLASRLRSTWLVTHLNMRTPLPILLPAAGLKTARPLGDLLAYTEPISVDDATKLLRGGS